MPGAGPELLTLMVVVPLVAKTPETLMMAVPKVTLTVCVSPPAAPRVRVPRVRLPAPETPAVITPPLLTVTAPFAAPLPDRRALV